MTDSPLSGRIALITGASGGIGKSIARGLAERPTALALPVSLRGTETMLKRSANTPADWAGAPWSRPPIWPIPPLP